MADDPRVLHAGGLGSTCSGRPQFLWESVEVWEVTQDQSAPKATEQEGNQQLYQYLMAFQNKLEIYGNMIMSS